MKYQYVAEIGKALTTIKRHFLPADPDESVPAETLNAIAKDVDAVIPLLKQYEWEFVADNSDRAAAGAKMPPELIKLEINLQDCRGLCRRIADEILQDDESGREAWSRRKGFFDWWLRLLWEYYPSLELRERPPLFTTYRRPSPQAAPKAEKRPSGRPQRTVEYYALDDDKSGYMDYLRTKLDCLEIGGDGQISAKDVGSLITAEIEEGRLRSDVSVAEFCREFGLNCSPQSVNDSISPKVRPGRKGRKS